MAVDQIPVSTGTCTCGCCGGEEKTVAQMTAVPVVAAKPDPEPTPSGCTCGESGAGCNCSGGDDCSCGSDRVA